MDRIVKQPIEGFTYVDLQRRTRFPDIYNDAITACKEGTAVDGRNPREASHKIRCSWDNVGFMQEIPWLSSEC